MLGDNVGMNSFRCRANFAKLVSAMLLSTTASSVAWGAEIVEFDESVRASSTVSGKLEKVTNSDESIPDQGYRVHAGIGLGFGLLDGSGFENTPSGTNFLAKLGIGRRTGRWEWDSSIGWGFSRRSGINDEGFAVGIQIRSARADFNARYRLWDGWAIGPVVALQFGTDTRYTQLLGDSRATPYIGSRTTIDMPTTGTFSVQLWGEALTEMQFPARDSFAGMVGVRIGLPVDGARTDAISVSQAAPSRDVRIVLDGSKVFFSIESDRLKPVFEERLGPVGQYLASHPEAWESITIEGHTDERGSRSYNQKLSDRRAHAVRKALESAGVESSRMSASGFGPDRPKDLGKGARPWARNRRVELVFHGVSNQVVNPESLRSLLEPLSAEQLQFTHKRVR